MLIFQSHYQTIVKCLLFTFYYSEKADSFSLWTLRPSHFPEGAPRRGKTPLRGSTFASVREGLFKGKRLRFFLRHKPFTHILLLSWGFGKLDIWYPNTACFLLSQKSPPTPMHGGVKTLPFWKKATPKTFTYQAPNPRIFGGSLAGRQVEKMVFRQAKRVLLRMCQFLKFSLHGSAKTADPFRCDLPLTHTIFELPAFDFLDNEIDCLYGNLKSL